MATATHPAEGGVSLSQYQATLPDGSLMEIEIFANDSLAWNGDFAVAAETGPYAHQTGSFQGTITGSQLNATCEAADGTSFQLSGTSNGDSSFTLVRSDIPGTTLTFLPVLQSGPVKRAETSFNLNTNNTSGRVVLSTTPFSVQGSGTMTEYRGTWLGLNVTFWAYASGYASVIVYVNDFAISTSNFSSYKLIDFGSANLTAASGRVSVYSAVTRSQFQFKNLASVSPG